MEQYVKGFKGFHAGEDVRPVTSCKFLLPRRRPLGFVCHASPKDVCGEANAK